MIAEKTIESAIIAKLNSLGFSSAWITGGWQSCAVGDTKVEPKDALCVIDVTAKPRSYDTYMTPACEISVDIAMSIRDELAPNGAAVAAYAEPLFNLLQSWQMSLATARTDLAITDFVVAGVRLDGGDTSRDDANARSLVTQSVTVKCVITNN